MTAEWIEWDAFPDKREPPRYHRVEITVGHHRRPPPRFLPIFVAIVVAVFLLWRFPFGVLMLAALVGSQTIAMFLFVIALLAIIALNERRHGREF